MPRLQHLILAALRSHLSGGKGRPPEAGVILWNAFGQLSEQRGWHAHGPNPITYADLEAWCRLMRLPLDSDHIKILIDMDRTWLEHTATKLNPGKDAPQRTSASPLSANLFDAMFT
ncbi:hypothetical protein MASR1M32_39130 [Rhodobacter sp.]